MLQIWAVFCIITFRYYPISKRYSMMERENAMPSMKDVARLAKVSVATVSCALSGKKSVAPETMKRIQSAIAELNYMPNLSARNLRNPISNEVGLILTDIGNTYQADFMKGVVSVLQPAGYTLHVAYSENIPLNETERLSSLLGKNISGLILFTCQPDNTPLFQNITDNLKLPVVFVERMPMNLECNFVSFDNYRMISRITQRLADLGCRRLSLVMGSDILSSEKDCLDAFLHTANKNGIVIDPNLICQTQKSKEDAFRSTLFAYEDTFPDAIITTSTELARGVCETLYIYGKKPNEEVLIISLGEESWLHTDPSASFFTTTRSAIKEGERAARILLQNIQSPVLFEKQTLLMQDNFNPETGIHLTKSAPQVVPPPEPDRPTLKILMVESASSHAIRILSQDFSRKYGIDVQVEVQPVTHILNVIREEKSTGVCGHDIYMFDIPWLPNIATNGLLADITDLITASHLETEHFLSENLENCQYDGRYYGIPVIGGTQMLLYRKDLFENPVLQNEFEKEYKVRMRPPVTWTEFNGICKFFTRSYNPKSPTPYGTAIGMSSREDLITYLFPYIWARGGEIFDSNDVLQISSPANALAIEDFLQTLHYTDGNYANTSLVNTVEQFRNGDIAMLIIFTLNLSLQHIQTALGDKVGYALLPRKQSVLPGWNFGVSNFTTQHANIGKFFEWFCQKHISYYLTILTGASTVIAPYENRQIRAMYPWLPLAAEGLKYGHLRTTFAHKSKWHAIPQDKIEDTIAQCIHDVLGHRMEVREALSEAENRLNALYTTRRT